MSKLPIYLDYAATTPVDPRVADVMNRFLTADGIFGNPASSGHGPGRLARDAVEMARQQVADLVNCEPGEIIFTSGATESDNLAIKGAAKFHARRGKHIITSRTEHKAVIDSCRALEKEGYEISWLKPGKQGIIGARQVEEALREDTTLVSIMHANNELGSINDVAEISRLLRGHSCLFHVDAAQSAGKCEIDLNVIQPDLMSFSAHKVYGPKGIGALYVRRVPKALLAPQMHGGGHELGLRSGTLATHQIAGMGEAFAIAGKEMADEIVRLRELRETLWKGIEDLPGVFRNSPSTACIPGLLNVCFSGVVGESLQLAISDLAVSAGSACNSANASASYVLRAIGLDDFQARSAIRFSAGRFTSEDDISFSVECIRREYLRLLELAAEPVNA